MAQTESPIEVANEFVTVRKSRVETEKEGVLGIELRFSTDADGPVDVRVAEQLPEYVSMQDVGLHPGYRPRNWTIYKEERRLVYEDVVSPDEELVTLYGVLTENYDDLEPFLGEPEIEHAAPAGDDGAGGDADVTSGGSVFGESLLGGSANGETEDRAFVYEGEQLEGSSLLGTDDAPDDTRQGVGAEAAEPAEPAASADATGGSLVSALLDEIEDEAVDDDELAALRGALGVEMPDSVNVRLSHLQSEVATLSAFADEFERFVDQEGGLGEVVHGLREGLRSVEAEMEELSTDVREQLDDVGERTKRVRGRLRDVDDLVEELTDDVESAADRWDEIREAHDADVDRLDARLDELDTDRDEALESVRADVEALGEELDAARQWRRSVVDSFGAIVTQSFERVAEESGATEPAAAEHGADDERDD